MKRKLFAIFLLLFNLLPLLALPAMGAEQRVVSEAEVRQVVTDFVLQRTANLGMEVRLKKVGFQGGVQLPPGKTDFEVKAPDRWEGWGTVNLALIVRVNDRVERNLTVRAEVEALADVVVATRPLERGELLAAGDVALQKRDMAGLAGRICRSIDEVVGQRLKSGVRATTPLRSDNLEKIPLVKSGQLVTILLDQPSLRISTTGKAKQNGAEGELIAVQNLSSQKDISARVVSAGTVRVEF